MSGAGGSVDVRPNLAVFGALNLDQFVHVPSIPAPGETLLAQGVAQGFGGKGANQAVAAARVGQGQIAVTMIGALGRDAAAEAVRDNLHLNGVATACPSLDQQSTGAAIVTLAADGENAIIVMPGANAVLKAEHADAALLGRCDGVICQGEVRIEETAALLARYKTLRPEGRAYVNLAPFPAEAAPATLTEILERADVVIVNEIEARALVLGLGRAASDLAGVSEAFGICLIVTLGARGAALYPAGAPAFSVQSPKVAAKDTTGAGDTFCGVLAALLTEGAPLAQAAELACRAAALTCTAVGAQAAMPWRAALAETGAEA
ncbi:PfkB family carbohydrate kinase [Arenibacterium sp. LLYu02]|uniref:PfkB family carbohydrate kinase n=1 Tax=Arenibacterium sp. LLYu02 TaxID=3404132 RepID=UPI003B20DEC2